jgi:hypothetical protein
VERAQLGERPEAPVHSRDAGVAADVPLAAHSHADDRRQEVLVDADEGAASVLLVVGAVEPVVPAQERLPDGRLAQRPAAASGSGDAVSD